MKTAEILEYISTRHGTIAEITYKILQRWQIYNLILIYIGMPDHQ